MTLPLYALTLLSGIIIGHQAALVAVHLHHKSSGGSTNTLAGGGPTPPAPPAREPYDWNTTCWVCNDTGWLATLNGRITRCACNEAA